MRVSDFPKLARQAKFLSRLLDQYRRAKGRETKCQLRAEVFAQVFYIESFWNPDLSTEKKLPNGETVYDHRDRLLKEDRRRRPAGEAFANKIATELQDVVDGIGEAFGWRLTEHGWKGFDDQAKPAAVNERSLEQLAALAAELAADAPVADPPADPPAKIECVGSEVPPPTMPSEVKKLLKLLNENGKDYGVAVDNGLAASLEAARTALSRAWKTWPKEIASEFANLKPPKSLQRVTVTKSDAGI